MIRRPRLFLAVSSLADSGIAGLASLAVSRVVVLGPAVSASPCRPRRVGPAVPGFAVSGFPVLGLAVSSLAVSRIAALALAALGLAVLASVPALAAADELDAVLQSLAARRHAETTFVELRYVSILKKPLESSGELVYDAPDRLQMRTLEPRPESLELTGTRLTARRGHTSRVLDLEAYPAVLPIVTSVRATLAGDRAALEQVFRLQFSGDLSRWTLALVPLDARLATAVAEVRIEGAKDDLLEVEVRRVDGDRSLLTLQAAASR
jgi:outer membrane lipoprotein-sorting protein